MASEMGSTYNRQYNPEEVVRALYKAVFGRMVDDSGLQSCLERLSSGKSDLESLADSLFHSNEHLSLFENFIQDHSQFGEFKLVLNHYVSKGSRRKIIVDLGARGVERSNSYDLLKQFGWTGLLIEANPALWDSIESDFQGTNFTLVKCAVSDIEGEMPFFIGVNDDVSSLSRELAEGWGDIKSRITVQVRCLGPILEEHRIPFDFDILSIDIEGYDVMVLNDLVERTEFRPHMIIIETSDDYANTTLESTGMSERIQQRYSLAYQTRSNMILVEKVL